MTKPAPRLYLIDGYSTIYRAFYAIRNLSNSKGLPTNAVYGFVQMLHKLLRDEEPEFVGVAMDVSGDTVRKQKFEEYKQNRRPMPEDLRPQIPWIRRVLEAHRIPMLELAEYEADDVLGTLAAKASAEGYEVILVSADKDLMQLVTDAVRLMHTGRDKVYDPALVEEDFGVPPHQVVDVLALQGDSVDNVPGVPGIGAKGAVQLIRDFESLEGLLDRAEEVGRKSYRTGLLEHREEAELSKELVQIHTDLAVEFEPDTLRLADPDVEQLKEMYRELEFTSLVEELGGASGIDLEPAIEIASPDEWDRAAAAWSPRLALSAVGPDGLEGPTGLAVADGERSWFVDFRREGLREPVLAWCSDWLGGDTSVAVGHDLKEVLRLIEPAATRPQTADSESAVQLEDTLMMSYVLRPALRGHGLVEVALDRSNHKAATPKEVGWDKGAEPPLGHEPLLWFAAESVALPLQWSGPMLDELQAQGLEGVYREIEEPLIPVLLAMEERGILLDCDFLESMSTDLASRLAKLEEAIYEIAGDEFNINSPRQLGEVMFERLGYPVLKRTRKTKSYSTSAEILQELSVRGYPMAERILEFREISKLKSTYVDAFPSLVSEDGRLHTRYYQAVAATGRLSSANPNLQNIPIRTELGQQIRKAFVAAEGCHLLVADYSQIELRVLAHIAEEPALLEAFERGDDIHRATAAAVFDVAPDLVTADQRRAAKVINFGILYGMSPFGLSQNLGISQGEAKAFIEAYLDRYAGVQRYMDETLEAAKEEGKVETLYGRVRWLPDIRSKNRNLRENAKRMAINARIQGTAADLLKKAMVAVYRRLATDHPEANLLLTVHDELVLEVPEGEVPAVSELVREEMQGVDTLRVPLVVDAGSGPSWYDAKG